MATTNPIYEVVEGSNEYLNLDRILRGIITENIVEGESTTYNVEVCMYQGRLFRYSNLTLIQKDNLITAWKEWQNHKYPVI